MIESHDTDPISAEALEALFNLSDAVDEEVVRINQFLRVRKPGTLVSQAWIRPGSYAILLDEGFDKRLMERVCVAFEEKGWSSEIKPISGGLPQRHNLCLHKKE